jgi:hypothetical protein
MKEKGRLFRHRRKSAVRARGRDQDEQERGSEGLRATSGAKGRAAMPRDLTARGRQKAGGEGGIQGQNEQSQGHRRNEDQNAAVVWLVKVEGGRVSV